MHYDKCLTWGALRPTMASEPPTLTAYPFRQGSLDSLCGVYAVTNAISYLLGIRRVQAGEQVFRQVVASAIQYHPLERLLLEGMDERLMSRVLREVAVLQYGLEMRRPFYHSRASLAKVWDRLREFTEGGGIVIMGDPDHWTVIHRVSSVSLLLSDSEQRGHRPKMRRRRALQRWGLEPRYLYFLSKSRGGQDHG